MISNSLRTRTRWKAIRGRGRSSRRALDRPEYLERERRDLVRAGFDRMFGHNASNLLALMEDCTRSGI
jgi:hypothetical protein